MAWMQIPWQQCWQLRLEEFSSTPRQPVGWHSLPRPEVPAAILGTMGWVFCHVTSRVAGILGAWGFDKYGTWGWLMGDVSSQLTVLTGMGMKQLGCSDAALCAPLFCSPVCEKRLLLVIWLGLDLTELVLLAAHRSCLWDPANPYCSQGSSPKRREPAISDHLWLFLCLKLHFGAGLGSVSAEQYLSQRFLSPSLDCCQPLQSGTLQAGIFPNLTVTVA